MKKVITCILSMMLICINVSSASATTNDVIKVSLENIEDIMIDNSPDMKIADNNLKKAEKEYHDFIDDYNKKVDEIEDAIDDSQDKVNKEENKNTEKINTNQASKNSELINQDPNDIKKEKENIKREKENLRTAKKQLRKVKNDKKAIKYNLKSAKLQYDQTVKQAVVSAQKKYIGYLDILSKKQSEEDKVNSKKKDAEIYKNKYDMGFISKKELNSNVTDNVDLDNNLEELKKQEALELKNLHNALGISQNQKIIFVNDINLDIDKISKINFQDDLNKMLENNVDIKIKDIEFDKSEDVSDEDYVVDNAEILLKQEKDNAKSKFEKQYNALITSCNTIKSKNGKLNDKQYDFGAMQTKYNYGFVSKRQVEDSKLEKDKQSAEFLSDKNTLYVNYLEYIQMKEGY